MELHGKTFRHVMKNMADTYGLAPGQPGGVMLLDVVLQLGPDGDVGLDPVHVHLISADETQVQDSETQTSVNMKITHFSL